MRKVDNNNSDINNNSNNDDNNGNNSYIMNNNSNSYYCYCSCFRTLVYDARWRWSQTLRTIKKKKSLVLGAREVEEAERGDKCPNESLWREVISATYTSAGDRYP